MTDSELIDHLARLVEKATPGKWWSEADNICLAHLVRSKQAFIADTRLAVVNHPNHPPTQQVFANALYIAACNPENMKRLLELARKVAEQSMKSRNSAEQST